MSSSQIDPSPIQVMLVDDSAIIRGLISRALQQDDRIKIVATASDGDVALSVLPRNEVDVILLDIEMPNKNGIEALPELLKLSPNARVIMVSTLTQRNAKISMQALELGASDYLAKPSSTSDKNALDDFYRELLAKVIALGGARKDLPPAATAMKAAVLTEKPTLKPSPKPSSEPEATSVTPPARPRILPGKKQVVAIASSTGGPQALVKLLSLAKNDLAAVPVFITQHMPATFTALLAEHIRNDTGLECYEAKHGEKVQAGRLYMAPGDYHMTVKKVQGEMELHLDQNDPVNFCRPAADPMFDSIAEHYGKSVLTLVLTGMGNDGCKGAENLKNKGAHVVVQDKESSVVWGMPGAIALKGFQDEIATIERMADCIKEAVG